MQIAKLLFSCGADPMLLTQDGKDILILSVLNGDIDSVAFLLEIGLDPNRNVEGSRYTSESLKYGSVGRKL